MRDVAPGPPRFSGTSIGSSPTPWFGTSGRRVRLTTDVEHRRFRLPAQELSVAPTGAYTTSVTRRYHAGASSTFLRLGAEVPVWR